MREVIHAWGRFDVGRYLIRRLLQAVPTLLGISIISFLIYHLAPGDPIRLVAFGIPDMTPQDIARLRHEYGLDQPLAIQYLNWLIQVCQLQFGYSFVTHQPVLDVIGERTGATLLLAGSSLLVGTIAGIAVGLYSALNRGRVGDAVFRVIAVVGTAIPSFWLGLVLILIFSVHWHVFPAGGMYALGSTQFNLADRLRHLIPPAIVLCLPILAGTSRILRTETLEVIGQDYVRSARAKGLAASVVTVRHILRNSLLPVVTGLGGALPALLGGAVIVEQVFSWPGLGRLGFESVLSRDYPVLMGLLLLVSALVVLGNVLSDVLYVVVDPRIRLD